MAVAGQGSPSSLPGRIHTSLGGEVGPSSYGRTDFVGGRTDFVGGRTDFSCLLTKYGRSPDYSYGSPSVGGRKQGLFQQRVVLSS